MTRRRALSLLAVISVLASLIMAAASPPTAQAETGKKALLLGSTVTGGATSAEANAATALGFTVTVVDDATWGAMTAAQFADYQLLVVGDPTCAAVPQVVSTNATAMTDAVMARAGGNTKVGNRVLIGTDPVFHFNQGGDKLIATAIDFAGSLDGATNLYLSTTCFDPNYDGVGGPDVVQHVLPGLTTDPTPDWTHNASPPCGGSASLLSQAAQFATLTSADLQGWFCSVHQTYPTFPSDWLPLAVATDTTSRPTCGNDVDTGLAACGETYILVSGRGLTATAPNITLTPADETLPVGSPGSVTATVIEDDGTTPRGDELVSFSVSGANAGAAGTCAPVTCKTGADGKVVFTYTGTTAGDDTVNGSITVDGSTQTATADKTWEAAPEPEGTIGCGATAARSGTTPYSVANPPVTPCADDDDALLPLNLGLVKVGLLLAASQVDDTVDGGFVEGTGGRAGARVAGASVGTGALPLVKVGVIESFARVTCVDGAPVLEGRSSTADVRVAGAVVHVRVHGTWTLNAGLIKLVFNTQTVSEGRLTQTALTITSPLLPAPIVLGESVVEYDGNPCIAA